jgi:hypothetical protein
MYDILFSIIKTQNKGQRMQKLLFSALLGLALLSLSGCGEDEKPQAPAAKCESGKCGEGKCGDQ